jgi:hypothetical protein
MEVLVKRPAASNYQDMQHLQTKKVRREGCPLDD